MAKPRPWSIKEITRFILFIGPISSIFDYTTYAMMWWVFGCGRASTHCPAALTAYFTGDADYREALFQTGWFVESLITQTLIIHVIRTNKIPFLQSRASWPMIVTTAGVMFVGVWLPFTPWGHWFNMVPLPGMFWPLLLGTLLTYVALTQAIKYFLARRGWI